MKVVFCQVNQNQVTHNPLCIVEGMSFEDIVSLQDDFKTSEAIVNAYAPDSGAKVLFIVLYEPLDSPGVLRRRIGASRTDLNEESIKNILRQILARLKFDVVFHSNDQLKKLLPIKREDRELLKKIITLNETEA